jgi:hypothetical protein
LVVETRQQRSIGGFGVGGDPDALATEFIPAGEDTPITQVIDTTSGEVIDRLPGTSRLVPTDDPGRAVAYFPMTGPSVGTTPSVARNSEAASNSARSSHSPRSARIASSSPGPVRKQHRPRTARIYLANQAVQGERPFELQRRDIDTGEVLASVPGFSDVAVGGGVVIASTPDGRIYELDPTTLDPIGAPFPGINPLTVSLRVDDLGQRLMVFALDETLRFYDIPTRTELGDAIDLTYPYALHPPEDLEGPGSAVLRGDGLRAAAETEQGIVVWDLEPAHWVDAACQLAGRNLTRAEWDQYIGDLAPYRQTCPRFAEA